MVPRLYLHKASIPKLTFEFLVSFFLRIKIARAPRWTGSAAEGHSAGRGAKKHHGAPGSINEAERQGALQPHAERGGEVALGGYLSPGSPSCDSLTEMCTSSHSMKPVCACRRACPGVTAPPACASPRSRQRAQAAGHGRVREPQPHLPAPRRGHCSLP